MLLAVKNNHKYFMAEKIEILLDLKLTLRYKI